MKSLAHHPLRLSLFAKIVSLMTVFAILPVFFFTGILVWSQHALLWPGLVGMGVISLFTVGAAFFFARHLTRPIRALMRGVERIAQGDFSTIVAVNTHDELQDLANAFNRMCED